MNNGDYSILCLAVASAHADAVAADVEELFGLSPVQFSRPHDTRIWVELYFSDPDQALLAGKALERDPRIQSVQLRGCPARDWQNFWRHHFQRAPIGKSYELCPPWQRDEPVASGRTRLIIDPGLSFGTGLHFTTRFCLETLETLPNPGGSFLDLGTGSGILAIAAAQRGYSPVHALDFDSDCVTQTHHNAKLNGVGGQVTCTQGDVRQGWGEDVWDVVCANLYAGLLMECAPRLAASAKQYLLVTGLREHEADGVTGMLQEFNLEEVRRDGDGEWAGALLRRV